MFPQVTSQPITNELLEEIEDSINPALIEVFRLACTLIEKDSSFICLEVPHDTRGGLIRTCVMHLLGDIHYYIHIGYSSIYRSSDEKHLILAPSFQNVVVPRQWLNEV